MLNRFALSPPRFAKTILRATSLLLLLGFPAFGPGIALIARGQEPLPETRVRLGTHVYTLEQAATPEQLSQGLMDRTRLPVGHGMLFAFPSPTEVRFWMKNTLIPLDMIFLSGGRVVFIQHDAPPCPAMLGDSCPTYGPERRVDQVVELPAGTARAHGLRPGVRMVRIAANSSASAASLKTQTGTPVQTQKPGERRH
jgi:uncharacterized membrane protein (UPF0127 family)